MAAKKKQKVPGGASGQAFFENIVRGGAVGEILKPAIFLGMRMADRAIKALERIADAKEREAKAAEDVSKNFEEKLCGAVSSIAEYAERVSQSVETLVVDANSFVEYDRKRD